MAKDGVKLGGAARAPMPDRIWFGFILAAVVNLTVVGLAIVTPVQGDWESLKAALALAAGLIGLGQIFWMVPVLLMLGGRSQAQKGVVVAMAVTMLLNFTCAAWVPAFF